MKNWGHLKQWPLLLASVVLLGFAVLIFRSTEDPNDGRSAAFALVLFAAFLLGAFIYAEGASLHHRSTDAGGSVADEPGEPRKPGYNWRSLPLILVAVGTTTVGAVRFAVSEQTSGFLLSTAGLIMLGIWLAMEVSQFFDRRDDTPKRAEDVPPGG